MYILVFLPCEAHYIQNYTYKGITSAIIYHCTARHVISCAIYCTGSVMCLPVMCSTRKLPVKTHDQATDHMANLPIENCKNWEEV